MTDPGFVKAISLWLCDEGNRAVVDVGDQPAIRGLLECVAQDPRGQFHESHMLIATQQLAVAGYLAAKYRGRCRFATATKDTLYRQQSVNVRHDIERSGGRATDARVEAEVRGSEQYSNAQAIENTLAQVADVFDNLRYALRAKCDALIEIARTERTMMRQD